jgi:transposase-like protein
MRYPSGDGLTVPPDQNHPIAVSACPFCASDRVSTTSKTPTVSTYWRCHSCGEIWNPGREAVAPAFARPRW